MTKTDEQKKARVTPEQKYRDNKRKRMGEEAYLAEKLNMQGNITGKRRRRK